MSPRAPLPVSEANVAAARELARRRFRSDLKVTRFWSAIVVVLLIAFWASWFGGAFDNRDRWVALAFFVVFFALMLWGAFTSDRRSRRLLAQLEAEPRLMSLVSEPRPGRKSRRPVTLRDGDAVVATAGARDRRGALFLLDRPMPVLVFGEPAAGQRVVCVGPDPRLIASLGIDRVTS